MSRVEQSVTSVCRSTPSEFGVRHAKGDNVHAPSVRKRFVHYAGFVKTLRLYNASDDNDPDVGTQATNRLDTLYDRFACVDH
jgi:hypothetical protein